LSEVREPLISFGCVGGAEDWTTCRLQRASVLASLTVGNAYISMMSVWGAAGGLGACRAVFTTSFPTSMSSTLASSWVHSQDLLLPKSPPTILPHSTDDSGMSKTLPNCSTLLQSCAWGDGISCDIAFYPYSVHSFKRQYIHGGRTLIKND
jgi:hypothetical protein